MFCETEQELELLGKLQRQFPEKNELLLELIAWVYVNKPDRFEQLMEEHKQRGEHLIDLGDVDYKTFFRNSQENPGSPAAMDEQIGEV